MTIPQTLQAELFTFIETNFSNKDLQKLCFRLGVNWDKLEGESVDVKAMSLVKHFDMEDPHRFDKLLWGLAKDRPDQLAGAAELLDEVCLYVLQLAEEGNGNQAARIFQSLRSVLDLPERLCSVLKKRFQELVQKQSWDDAEKLLIGLKNAVPDLKCIDDWLTTHPRGLYQCADELEKKAQWDEARQSFQDLDEKYPGYRDTAARLAVLRQWENWYENGRRAWDGGQWERAEAFFTNLTKACPTYKDARPRVDALQSYGAGSRFLDVQDYAQAETAFAQVRQTFPALLQRRLPIDLEQRTQRLVQAQKWIDAQTLLERLSPLLDDYAGLEPLRALLEKARQPNALYRQAVECMEQRQWDQARETFQDLEKRFPGYRDAAARLSNLDRWERGYAAVRTLWDSQQWDESVTLLETLVGEQPAYKDAAERRGALRRCQELADKGLRLIDNRQHLAAARTWDQAEKAFQEIHELIPGYRDASAHLLYVRALRAIHHQTWGGAAQHLADLRKQKPDYAHVNALGEDVQRLQETIGQLAGGFLRDPLLRWTKEGHPYDVFRQAGLGVTPASSMQAIGDLSFDLQKVGMSPEQRTAWDVLRDVDRRLLADAFLYRVAASDQVIAFLEDEMAQGFQLPSVQSVASRFPAQSPLLLLLWGMREEAAAALVKRQREGPAEVEIAHQLGLLYLAEAEELDSQKKTSNAIQSWRQAIGQWAIALTDERYWQNWGAERARCYGRPVLPGQIDRLRTEVEKELLRRLSLSADWHMRDRRTALAEDYQRLQWELQAELTALRLLHARELGGIPTETHGRVFCGPAALGALGQEESLARYAARLTDELRSIDDQLLGAPAESTVHRLRCYFSTLRVPAVLLEGAQPDPKRALEQLKNSRQVEQDAPYRALQKPGDIAQQDTCRLMTQARLKLAEERITREELWDLRAARADWRAALDLARRWDGEESIAEIIRNTALARAAALGRDPRLHSDTDRMDQAIALLETAAELVGQDQRLALRLAEQLTNRGVHKANCDDHRGAVCDLERAFRLTPHNHHTRDQYATALAFLALDTANEGRRSDAKALLDRAEQLVADGQRDKPDYAEYKKTADLIDHVRAQVEGGSSPLSGDPFAQLDMLLQSPRRSTGKDKGEQPNVSSLLVQATLQRRAGNPAGALATLERAWELAPQDRDVQEELVAVLTERAGQLAASGAVQEQQQLIETWRERFASHESLSAQLDYLQWGPRIRNLLGQTDLKYRYSARQVMLFPFDSSVVGTLMLRLAIEGDLMSLAGPLPPIAEADEILVLENLLQSVGELMFYRLGRLEGVGLALVCRVPIHCLSAPWLEALIRGMAQYADAQPTALKRADQWQTHLRSRRELVRLAHPGRLGSRVSLGPLESLCQSAGWACARADDEHGVATCPLGQVDAQVFDEGVRLALDLGVLKPASDQVALLRQIVRLNNTLGLGKLGLTDNGRVQFQCDLPELDETNFAEARRLIERRADGLRRELTQ